jgi:hypothetical protein
VAPAAAVQQKTSGQAIIQMTIFRMRRVISLL